jgi:hypothetical protein
MRCAGDIQFDVNDMRCVILGRWLNVTCRRAILYACGQTIEFIILKIITKTRCCRCLSTAYKAGPNGDVLLDLTIEACLQPLARTLSKQGAYFLS